MKKSSPRRLTPLTLLACIMASMAFPPAPALAKTSTHQPSISKETTRVATPPFSAKDQEEIARLQTALNDLKTIAADFVQVDDMGGMMTGQIAIMRRNGHDGKMRVTYDPPSTDFIVADGSLVHIWNGELQSQTNVEQGSSLAEFILRDPVELSGDIKVTKLVHAPAKIELTLVERDDEAAGQLTLVFEDNPLQLRQWKVLDPQGHTTGVSLRNIRQDVTFAASTFTFVPPTFGKGGGVR